VSPAERYFTSLSAGITVTVEQPQHALKTSAAIKNLINLLFIVFSDRFISFIHLPLWLAGIAPLEEAHNQPENRPQDGE
jgi:hypothetical protein